MIRSLEGEEEGYISDLQTRSTGPDGDFVFNASFSKQPERARLYAVRLQIYNCSCALQAYLVEIEKTDPALADEERFSLLQTMMIRRDRLLMEVRAYVDHGHGEVGMNAGYVKRNRRLAEHITSTFSLPGTY
ncbi:hypothetical protein BGZ95_007711 [Linnemannia exigua]|uniref:Uncharacterized protein n=1 Tax=Linnemannia exigua TaxID=604196 RepID=A0AAD4DET7_9FUNG|nr:hypothetical protein BGZ95_007711 [Linnemannia exigua]